jgi:adenylate cyclase
VSGSFGVLQVLSGEGMWQLGMVNLVTATVFLLLPLLHNFGELVAPMVFIVSAYTSVFAVCWHIGTDSGLQFYFLVSAAIGVLILGVERVLLASVVAAVGVALTIALEFLVPDDRGVQPAWSLPFGFVTSTISAAVMVFATVWYAMREIDRAETAMELEYARSEALLDNMLPASIANRLKDPDHDVIADKYDDASILFADIAGFTARASDISPADLVRFLDELYSGFDRLVDQHGLEKIKTSGDSYMVVSGVPEPRPDHLHAIAELALDMAESVAVLVDRDSEPVPLRIGIGAGPVVAGVVGARRFFYDVWGDAVNVASRMESTDAVGRIQVPDAVYQRLRDDFEFEERGDVAIKGKGVMHTWYLTGRRRPDSCHESLRAASQLEYSPPASP